MTDNEKLQRRVTNAVKKLVADTSVSRANTLENLLVLANEIELHITALKEELDGDREERTIKELGF